MMTDHSWISLNSLLELQVLFQPWHCLDFLGSAVKTTDFSLSVFMRLGLCRY